MNLFWKINLFRSITLKYQPRIKKVVTLAFSYNLLYSEYRFGFVMMKIMLRYKRWLETQLINEEPIKEGDIFAKVADRK